MKAYQRLIDYVKIPTASDPETPEEQIPSTERQWVLARLLKQEMEQLGVEDVQLDEHCYLFGRIPGNIEGFNGYTIGFIAHIDVSPEAPSENVEPRIVHYLGGDIMLDEENGVCLKTSEFPQLIAYYGEDLLMTDGKTLLGADDKAGVAESMFAAQYLMEHPEIKHGVIKIGFTPDEEIGRGVAKFDVQKFGAQYAYTMDGGEIGELEYENFNAAAAKIHVQGSNIHPGYGKDKMVNAMLIAMELNAMLPVEQRPRYTQGYEGFFHLTEFNGTVEEASMNYIIRDHDRTKFEEKKALMTSIVKFLNQKYGKVVKLQLKHQYYNMRQEVEPHFFIVEKAIKAMEMAGVKPKVQPIRGGTDGANLSFMGLPCPNIFAGGHNFHGKLEYVPLESMEKAAEVILNIVKLFAE